MRHIHSGSTFHTVLISIVAVVAFLGLAVAMLPKGFSSDTSIIGKGSNVAVLAHNKDSVQSLNVMDYMNKVRGEYEGRIEFVVADFNTPQGSSFIQSQRVDMDSLLLFSPEGKRLQVVTNIKSVAALRAALDTTFK